MKKSIYELIISDIYKGNLQWGSKLKIAYLCNRYNSTTPPVREALSGISEIGLINKKVGQGFSVRELSQDDFLNIYEISKLIVPKALEKAMLKPTADWNQEIQIKLLVMEHFQRPELEFTIEEFTYWEDICSQFYSTIFNHNQPEIYKLFLRKLDLLSKPYRFTILHRLEKEYLQNFYEKSFALSKKLSNNIAANDIKQAKAIIIEILDTIIKESEGFFKNNI